MTTTGIIGSGHVGGNLAQAAIAHGYEVVLSNSQGPDSLAGLALLALGLGYEHRRLTPVVLSSYVATAMTGDSPGVT